MPQYNKEEVKKEISNLDNQIKEKKKQYDEYGDLIKRGYSHKEVGYLIGGLVYLRERKEFKELELVVAELQEKNK